MLGGVTAVAGAGALILGLAIVDERVRTQLGRVVSGRPPTEEIVSFGAQLQELLNVLGRGFRIRASRTRRW